MNNKVLKQITEIKTMTMAELRDRWRTLYETTPPPYNKAFLVRRLIYRVQELACGGLSEEIRQRMEDSSGNGKDPNLQTPLTSSGENMLTGTTLIREWKGVDHCVTVLDDGFEYQGRRFNSLSAVARSITGTRWNGKVFFGIKKNSPKRRKTNKKERGVS
ncbi:MAG: DUF2924 domain-containing protein [Magnetococcales bacterium]|nr:DUF2924 domain-containing protein [Magnetococcales bacterium]